MGNTPDYAIDMLGPPEVPSPLNLSTKPDDDIADYTPDAARVLIDPTGKDLTRSLELAGPRERNFFRGADVTAGIVTCGGLSPGMNNVIRGLVLRLWFAYGCRRIFGFRYGYGGLAPDAAEPPVTLEPPVVRHIHQLGGTVLGSSRGPLEAKIIVDTLQRLGINAFFAVGGDGTMRGLRAVYEEICRRQAAIAVIGVPKTIDNDLPLIEKTFGFDTAVSIATEAIRAAHVEAICAPNGVGLVRLMGRHSGFITASATLASREVNLVLVPELPFDLFGQGGILAHLRQRLAERHHAVVVVAEGAGQRHLPSTGEKDLSGNVKLADIGTFLRDTIKRELADLEISLKYIDPSYIIRATPANASDAIFCGQLAEDAVHAAMAGKTGMMVGMWLNRFTHVPLTAATDQRKTISLDSSFWRNVVESTGQPMLLTNG